MAILHEIVLLTINNIYFPKFSGLTGDCFICLSSFFRYANNSEIISNYSLFHSNESGNKGGAIYIKNSSKFNRIAYFNNQFIDIPIKLSNEININDIGNFNSSYYVSSNSGLIKINEKLDNINNVTLNEIGQNTIIAFAENDYYKAILLSDGNLLLY